MGRKDIEFRRRWSRPRCRNGDVRGRYEFARAAPGELVRSAGLKQQARVHGSAHPNTNSIRYSPTISASTDLVYRVTLPPSCSCGLIFIPRGRARGKKDRGTDRTRQRRLLWAGSASDLRKKSKETGNSCRKRSGGDGGSSSSDGKGALSIGGRYNQPKLSQKLTDQGVKLVLLGEMSAGKTSVVLRLVKNTFPDKVEPTIGAAFMVHKMVVGDRTVKLEIWDTAGQERYRSLAPMYYRGASAAVIVYDVTKKDSFETMKRWIDELRVRAPPNIVLAIAGNKVDLESERAVSTRAALEYVGMIEQQTGGERPIFGETSAKTGVGVNEIFQQICQRLIAMAEREAS